ncbi:MAG: AMP-binding protein [Actinomycetota bacterium]|nr:AMP-binding protein [Actinomycetota bacterium]
MTRRQDRLERSEVLGGGAEPLLEVTTGALFRQVAAEVPSRTALVEVAPAGPSLVGASATDRTWTYAELTVEVNHTARWLLDRFEPGDRVAVWAPNVPEWVILQYGAALAGLVLVTANPALTADEIAYVLARSRSRGPDPRRHLPGPGHEGGGRRRGPEARWSRAPALPGGLGDHGARRGGGRCGSARRVVPALRPRAAVGCH